MAKLTLEVDATANSSQSSKTEIIHTEGSNASVLKTTFWNTQNNTHDDYNHLFMRHKHTGIGTDWDHNPGEVQPGVPLFCVQPPSQFLESVTVAPENVAGGTTNSCHFFKVGSGNNHATNFGTDIIYERPKPCPTVGSGTGAKGTWRWDSDRFYFCTSTNVWKKIELQTFGSSTPSEPTLHIYDQSNQSGSWLQLGAGSHVVVTGNGSSGENAQQYRFQLPQSPSEGDFIEVQNNALVLFRLATQNTNTLYVASRGTSTGSYTYTGVSNNKSIYFSENWLGNYKIIYAETPSTAGQFRWISSGGYLI